MTLRIYLAGSLALAEGDTALTFTDLPGPRGIGAVAFLATEHLRPVSSIELADVVWDGSPPPTWKSSLKALISRTRTALRPLPSAVISSGRGWYQLPLPADGIVDVLFAENSIHQAEGAIGSGDAAHAASAAGVAAMIASRPILPELSSEWAEELRQSMQQVHLRALDILTVLWLQSGQYEQAIVDANRILEIDPLREAAYATLMSAHLATGRVSRGLAIYETCREILATEVGASPGRDVDSLYEQLLRHSS